MLKKYTPTVWVANKTVATADILNNIEKGISSAHDRIDVLETNLNEINARLENILATLSTLEQSNK